jgi:hypothetical protein
MSTKVNKLLKHVAIVFFGSMIALTLLGFTFFPRPDFLSHITEDYCSRYNIRFDSASIRDNLSCTGIHSC